MSTALERTIAIIFEGDDRTQAAFKAVQQNLDEFDTAVQSVADPLADLADRVLGLDAALGAMAIGGLVVAYGAAKDFDAAMVGLKKVLGEAEFDHIPEIKQSVLELSDAYGVSSTQILESITGWKQAGFETEEAVTLARNTLDLMIAGDLSAGDATEALISTLKGFKLSAEDAARAVDIVNEVSNRYATDSKELASALGALSPIARQAGFSMEEAAGLVTPIIEVFRSGSEAADALKTGLLKMTDDSKPVVDTLAQLGVSQRDANGELRSAKDILVDVADKFQSLDQNQKLFYTSQLVGIEQSARMVEVFDQLGKYSDITAAALDSAGSAAAEVAAKLKSAEAVLDRFKVGFQNLALTVGAEFQTAANEAIEGGTAIENALRRAVDSGALDQLSRALSDYLGDVGKALKNIAEDIPDALDQVDFSGFIQAMGDLGEEIAGLFDGFDLSTPEGLAEALQFAVDSISTLVGVSQGMVTSLQPVIDSFTALQGKANEAGQSIAVDIGRVLGAAKLLAEAGTYVGGFLVALQTTGADANRVFETVIGVIKAVYNASQVLLDSWTMLLANTLGPSLEALSFISEHLGLDDASRKLADLSESIRRVGEAASETQRENIDEMFEGIGRAARGISGDVDGAADSVKKVPEAVREAGISLEEFQQQLAGDHEFVLTTDVDTTGVADFVSKPLEKNVEVKADPDTDSFHRASDIILEILPDGTRKFTCVGEVDKAALEKTAEEIKKAVPDEKRIQIETELEMARIDADVKKIESMLDFRAKIDVAEIEAATERIKAAFESASETIGSTGDVISGILSELSDFMGKDATSSQLRNALLEQLEQENEYRERALSLQEDLTKAQVEYMEAKRAALERGEALVRVEATNLAPALEMIFINVLELCQVRATEEGLEALLGL